MGFIREDGALFSAKANLSGTNESEKVSGRAKCDHWG